jgi:hypothetical protein
VVAVAVVVAFAALGFAVAVAAFATLGFAVVVFNIFIEFISISFYKKNIFGHKNTTDKQPAQSAINGRCLWFKQKNNTP